MAVFGINKNLPLQKKSRKSFARKKASLWINANYGFFLKTKLKKSVSNLFRDYQCIIIFSTLLQTINFKKVLLFELFLLIGITKSIPSFLFYFNKLSPGGLRKSGMIIYDSKTSYAVFKKISTSSMSEKPSIIDNSYISELVLITDFIACRACSSPIPAPQLVPVPECNVIR